MPHRDDIEGAPELEHLGVSGEVSPKQNDVGNALVSLALEVMLSHPESVESEVVHQSGHLARGVQALHEPVVGVSSLVSRRSVGANIFQVNVADVEDREVLNHAACLLLCRMSYGAKQHCRLTERGAASKKWVSPCAVGPGVIQYAQEGQESQFLPRRQLNWRRIMADQVKVDVWYDYA